MNPCGECGTGVVTRANPRRAAFDALLGTAGAGSLCAPFRSSFAITAYSAGAPVVACLCWGSGAVIMGTAFRRLKEHEKCLHPRPGDAALAGAVHLPAFGLAVKRLIDVTLAAALLVVLAPVNALAAVAVRASMGKPVLFVQERPGKHEAPFKVLKLRTMSDERDAAGRLLPDGRRLTRLGRLLRTTSLDELPQLINVVAGDMSLIGPRPLLMRYLPYFTERERARFAVRPGISGLAQVSGRNLIGWDEKLALDVWYVEHWSMLLDLRVAVRTMWTVLSRHGLEEDPESVMPYLDVERQGRIQSS